ncbi:MAG: HAD-IA family hydrolase [Acetobacteraceae bacterium]|nr:HAD-IA family hydrolase [Acetobacteraceae bacterium]
MAEDRNTESWVRPSLLLYDWDNTLVDAWAGITAAMNAAMTAFAMPLWTVEQTRERARISMRDSFPVIFGDRWHLARNIFHATMKEQHLDHVRPMPGALDALEASAPWPMGVVSNKSGRYLRAEIAHLGWSSYFGAVVGAGDAKADKPDPAPLLMALEQLGAEPANSVWYLGDTATDMQAARAAGITGVLVGDAAHDGGVERAAPDLQFADAYRLAAFLRNLHMRTRLLD